MLETAGFGKVTLVATEGGRAEPEARTFAALAQRD
jgi:hypothetical protein